jgi:hypothetical protein
MIFGKTCLSVGGPTNSVGHNCGKENASKMYGSQMILQYPTHSSADFLMCYNKRGSIRSDQSASSNRGGDFSS